jgi:hypothetical protein
MEDELQDASTMPTGVSTACHEHGSRADDALLLATVSLLTLICATVRILFHPGGAELSLVAAAIWILFFALTAGGILNARSAQATLPARPERHRQTEPPPFQFGLSDLLCAVFVVAFLMGIIAMMGETDTRDESFVSLWNFMSGSVLAVSATLSISGWRSRYRAGWIVGIPVFLGTLAHMIWGLAADDYVLLVWSFIGLWFGFSGLRCCEHQAAQTPST